ncbi:MAG: aminopeptidase, partial [Pseudomonadota bacterium]
MTLRISRTLRLAMIAGQVIWLSACANLPYYAQAIDGHFDVVRRSQPISTIIANPNTDQKLKHSLSKVVQLREFASRELKLPDNLSYTSYADLERPMWCGMFLLRRSFPSSSKSGVLYKPVVSITGVSFLKPRQNV